MTDLLVFEPLPLRQRKILGILESAGKRVEIVTDFDKFRKRLEGSEGRIALLDMDLLPEHDRERILDKLRFCREFHVLVAFSEQNETMRLSFTLHSGIPVLPLNARLSAPLTKLIDQAQKQLQELRQTDTKNEIFFVGEHPSVKEVLKKVDLIADTDANVLITGATGSGKTVLAKLIHHRSYRRNEPFIHINCAAIPDQLLEAELFGYKKGAFTGALKDTSGKFKAAGRGTILLDEIGEMPIHLQAKLLKVLDENQYYPIGGTQLETVSARIIAATNKNLFEEMSQKNFRMDLFYRLNSFEIHIPSLKERREDIPLLFNFYVDIYVKKHKLLKPQIQYSVYEVLRQYDWPGNVRELQNLVETLLYFRPEYITLELLPQRFFSEYTPQMVKMGEEFRSLDEIKKSYAVYILEHVQGNKSKAAKILGIDIKTFNKLIKEF